MLRRRGLDLQQSAMRDDALCHVEPLIQDKDVVFVDGSAED